MNEYLSERELKFSNWTSGLIRELLGEPDTTDTRKSKLYLRSRVEVAQADPIFVKRRRWKKKATKEERNAYIRVHQRDWNKANPEKRREYDARWYRNHLDKATLKNLNGRKNRPHYDQIRYANDVQFKLSHRYRSTLIRALRHRGIKENNTVFDLVGCTAEELKIHFELQFVDGMSWHNRRKWHIDHIDPVRNFDLTDDNQLHACFRFTNLRPLWVKDNLTRRFN